MDIYTRSIKHNEKHFWGGTNIIMDVIYVVDFVKIYIQLCNV
jgi:hypothetical protein